MTIPIDYACDECCSEFTVEVTPARRATIKRDPENSQPPQGTTVSPSECPECGAAINLEIAAELAEGANER